MADNKKRFEKHGGKKTNIPSNLHTFQSNEETNEIRGEKNGDQSIEMPLLDPNKAKQKSKTDQSTETPKLNSYNAYYNDLKNQYKKPSLLNDLNLNRLKQQQPTGLNPSNPNGSGEQYPQIVVPRINLNEPRQQLSRLNLLNPNRQLERQSIESNLNTIQQPNNNDNNQPFNITQNANDEKTSEESFNRDEIANRARELILESTEENKKPQINQINFLEEINSDNEENVNKTNSDLEIEEEEMSLDEERTELEKQITLDEIYSKLKVYCDGFKSEERTPTEDEAREIQGLLITMVELLKNGEINIECVDTAINILLEYSDEIECPEQLFDYINNILENLPENISLISEKNISDLILLKLPINNNFDFNNNFDPNDLTKAMNKKSGVKSEEENEQLAKFIKIINYFNKIVLYINNDIYNDKLTDFLKFSLDSDIYSKSSDEIDVSLVSTMKQLKQNNNEYGLNAILPCLFEISHFDIHNMNYNKIIKISKELKETIKSQKELNLLNNHGKILYLFGKYFEYEEKGKNSKKVIDELEKVLKDHPRFTIISYFLGCVYFEEGKYEQAKEKFSAFIEKVATNNKKLKEQRLDAIDRRKAINFMTKNPFELYDCYVHKNKNFNCLNDYFEILNHSLLLLLPYDYRENIPFDLQTKKIKYFKEVSKSINDKIGADPSSVAYTDYTENINNFLSEIEKIKDDIQENETTETNVPRDKAKKLLVNIEEELSILITNYYLNDYEQNKSITSLNAVLLIYRNVLIAEYRRLNLDTSIFREFHHNNECELREQTGMGDTDITGLPLSMTQNLERIAKEAEQNIEKIEKTKLNKNQKNTLALLKDITNYENIISSNVNKTTSEQLTDSDDDFESSLNTDNKSQLSLQ